MTSSATVWVRYELALRALAVAASALREAGVPVVPVKGVALARWLYDDVVQRPFMDVDLLVSRRDLAAARFALLQLSPALYDSAELGEVTVSLDGFPVELHAEIGRLEITDLVVSDVVSRATVDERTFDFPVLRIDDIDHLLLVAVNAVKDGFSFAQPHIPGDLEKLLARVDPVALVSRARTASFSTGLHCTALWMGDRVRSEAWLRVAHLLGPPRRLLYARACRAFWRSSRGTWPMAVTLGCWANDRPVQRVRAVGRVLRRNAIKLIGRTPP